MHPVETWKGDTSQVQNAFYPNDLARNGTGKCPACSGMLPHSGNLGQVLTRTWKEKKEHLSFENI